MNIFNKLVFVPDEPFQSSLIFVSETGAYPSEAPAPGLTHKRQNRLERPTRDKRSKLTAVISFVTLSTRPPSILTAVLPNVAVTSDHSDAARCR
jgi:hypothetical protein